MSVCLSQLSTAASACGGFAAVGPADRRYRSIAARPAGAQQQGRRSSNGEQCHVYSRRRRLDTDLFCSAVYIYSWISAVICRCGAAAPGTECTSTDDQALSATCCAWWSFWRPQRQPSNRRPRRSQQGRRCRSLSTNSMYQLSYIGATMHSTGPVGRVISPSTLQNEGTKTIWSPPLRLIWLDVTFWWAQRLITDVQAKNLGQQCARNKTVSSEAPSGSIYPLELMANFLDLLAGFKETGFKETGKRREG